MPLARRAGAFDHPDWVFEVKLDGFRSLAVLHGGEVKLVSRRGHIYKSFPELGRALARHIPARSAVLDGEIVCLDRSGRTQFAELLYRRGTPYFYAYDLLAVDGRDLRGLTLLERKAELRKLLPAAPAELLYSDHLEREGTRLFAAARQLDLEGVVAKWKHGRYVADAALTTWIKIKNPAYSQMKGRDEMFEKRVRRR